MFLPAKFNIWPKLELALTAFFPEDGGSQFSFFA